MRSNNMKRVLGVAAAIFCLAALLRNGRSVEVAPQQPAPPAQPSPTSQDSGSPAPEFFVMIDPAHGGDDKGATLGTKSLEKDFTLALARELKKELQERGIRARLLRDSDRPLGLERRAEITNEDRAAVYVALHASTFGAGVRVYSCALTPGAVPAGRFLPWESAQSGSLEKSHVLVRSVAPALRKKGLQVATLASPLRPLNNVVAPAIAVELAPSASLKAQESSKLRSAVASGVAEGIAQARWQMGVRP